jgi:cysteine-rich repeat protein
MRAALLTIALPCGLLSCATESRTGQLDRASEMTCEQTGTFHGSASMPVDSSLYPTGRFVLDPDDPPASLADEAAALATQARAAALALVTCPAEATPAVWTVAGTESLVLDACLLTYEADFEVTCECAECDYPALDPDGDGTPSCYDECPDDPDKIDPGACGCGVADEDVDQDGTLDCSDPCPDLSPPYPDRDGDGTPDCSDECPDEPGLATFGPCDCETTGTGDRDGDGVDDCADDCPDDPDKTSGATCGCGEIEVDADEDGVPDCHDDCPLDPDKTSPGECGCGLEEDGDGEEDCSPVNWCPEDPCAPGPLVVACDPEMAPICLLDPYCCEIEWDEVCVLLAEALLSCSPGCGDGEIAGDEQCDDGNAEAGDGCDASCRLELCGNGILQAGESCDDGNGEPADGCSPGCQVESCGDGIQQPPEECDDGNTVDGDGCSAACTVETGGPDGGPGLDAGMPPPPDGGPLPMDAGVPLPLDAGMPLPLDAGIHQS